MAVVNVMFGGYDLSDELAEEIARAEAVEKTINDELDGLADLLESV